MFNRKWIYAFTLITLTAAILLNVYFFQIGFGMFFFIPMFGFIVLYPRWLTGYLCCLAMPLIRLLTEYFSIGHFSSEFLIRLTVTSVISWFILITITFFIIKLNDSIQTLEHLSLTDNLTKAFNRRYLELYSEKLLATSERYNQPFCLIILDIDHFKKINDTYSHRVGDLILQKLAHVVQSTIRQGDIFVRLGGEEFALILPNTTLKEGFNTAERVRRSIQAANFNFKGNHIPVTVSLGVSQYSKGPIEQTFDQADRALYQAKANGRNQVMKF